jgi:exosortase
MAFVGWKSPVSAHRIELHMTIRSEKIKSADTLFLAFIAVSLAVFGRLLFTLAVFAFDHEYCSHIILIPAISIWLAYSNRKAIRTALRTWPSGTLLAVPAVPVLLWAFARRSSLDPGDFLAATTFSIVCVWIGGFAVCYGPRALRAAIFPLLFLFLMVPLPAFMLEAAVHSLQKGSTEITYWMLQAVGQPALKDGFTIYLPKLTILVAEECSGIRSTVALFITCLLVAHMLLKSNWRRTVFVLISFPVALIKNGIRIAALVLLSIHVDMRFMTSSLHKDGGFVFFLIALLIMYPFLKVLQRSDAAGNLHATKKLAPAETHSST